MKRTTILLLLLILAVSSTYAAPRTKAQAKAIAEKLAEKIGSIVYNDAVTSRKAPIHKVGVEETSAYYIFDYGKNEGFIIVSGDDRMPEIVGYTDTGAFDEENMPEQLKYFLEAYTRTVAAVAEGNTIATENANQASNATSVTPVAPLLGNIAWDQGDPYNQLCPTINGKKTVTGCAATAMAQIMRYHKFPINQVAISGYTTETNKISIPAISASTKIEDQYDWDNMLPIYTSSATEQQQNAVAKLMYHVGVALKMDYGLSTKGGSGAYYDAQEPAFKTFGYDQSLLQTVYRNEYTYSEWQNIIRRELKAKRPIAYSGQSSGGGHSFVCDGIDSNGLVHINWGWGGSCNGYFDVSVLNPNDNSGIGASSTTDGYSGINMMVIGITPDNTSGESKVANGTFSSNWNNISITIASGEADGKLYYNNNYEYLNKLIITVDNNSDKEFYNSAKLLYSTSKSMPESSNGFPNLYISLEPGEKKQYEMDVTINKSKDSYPETMYYWVMKNAGSTIMASGTYSVLEVADPILKVTSITSNASTNDNNRHQVTLAGKNVLVPSVLDDKITYNVTFSNSGGNYHGKEIKFMFYDIDSNTFYYKQRTVEIPNGDETCITITDNNPIYGKTTGLWVYSEMNFLKNNTLQSLPIVGSNSFTKFTNIYFCYAEGPTKQITISDANHSTNDNCYYSTLYLDHAVTIPDGVKAYTVEIKSQSEIVLTKIEQNVIPAYTGVVLEMTSIGDYDFPATTTDLSIGSDLQGVLTQTETSAVSGTVYVLNIQDGSPMFSKYLGSALAANKGYLVFPSSEVKYIFRYADKDVDAIHSSKVQSTESKIYFNLQGIPVTNPTRGIYIHNGKKTIIK